jgi:hypothetical protein
MNFDRSRLFLSRLSVKHRDLNISVPFRFNPNQQVAFRLMAEQYASSGQVRCIVLKARRVGMSSLMDALLWVHTVAKPQAHAQIIAHLKDVSAKGLFRVPRDLASELNEKVRFPVCDVRAQEIRTAHSDGESLLDISTAGSVGGGRGLTLTALHLSEAASYPGQDSFLSILPAVAKAPDTMIVLESTAQGRTGIGKVFYEHWLSAKKGHGRHWNGYVPIFLPWLDDPACIAAAHMAKDAPATDLERELMSPPYNATRAQIAWMRLVLEGECQGSELKFLQEYPHADHVAFVSTGDPAFSPTEIKYAISTRVEETEFCQCVGRESAKCTRPHRGILTRSGGITVFYRESAGAWRIYETPKRGCFYYVGVDCARGMEEETGRATGDFSSIIVYNGTTGDIAARFAEWADPEITAEQCDLVGRWYGKAMMNVELTGNLGLWCMKRLRDNYHYPNFYRWKGKDDKALKPNASHPAICWETTTYSRNLMFASFRAAVRAGMKGIPGGLAPKDSELIDQMDLCTMSGGRFEVEKGHDDVLFAAMIAVVACDQWPPPNVLSFRHNVLENPEEARAAALASLNPQSDLQMALKRDFREFNRPEKSARLARNMRMTY